MNYEIKDHKALKIASSSVYFDDAFEGFTTAFDDNAEELGYNVYVLPNLPKTREILKDRKYQTYGNWILTEDFDGLADDLEDNDLLPFLGDSYKINK